MLFCSRLSYGRRHIINFRQAVHLNTYEVHIAMESQSVTHNELDECDRTFEVNCEHEMQLITFEDVQIRRGQCIQHFPWKCIFYGGMDNATGKFYQLSEWVIENQDGQPVFDHDTVLKRIKGIEKEFEHLSTLKHPNLINYIHIQHVVESQNRIVVNVLSDFIMGSNCNDLYLNKGIPVELVRLREICLKVLNALRFLHVNNIVHKQVSGGCIYICNNGSIKLANASVHQKLTDLALHDVDTKPYSKKRDIFNFGVTVLSLALATVVNEDDISIPTDIGADLKDLIETCIFKYTRQNDLTSHQFFRTTAAIVEPQSGISHLKTGFDSSEYIGEGAFGTVHKVRHKIDGKTYALKCVKLKNKTKIESEVTSLSSLNHENIVKYYHSWEDNSKDFPFDINCPEEELEYSSEDDMEEDHGQYRILCILMEYCDLNTLKSAIEGFLCEDTDRMWRYLREILEGLVYIHAQGLIHRDLKPGNIFLSATDNVKIGDFGLATSSFRTGSCVDLGSNDPSCSLTGQIGTYFYRAPECCTDRPKYDQKIDLYSLGIIFFEMSNKPFSTEMERRIILTNLRAVECRFPDNVDPFITRQQKRIIQQLLDHNISKRPSARDLLESKDLPPPIPKEKELKDMLRHTLNNTHRKEYKYLIHSCLNQQSKIEQDITYDEDSKGSFNMPRLKITNVLKDFMVKLFRSYKAQELNTPILMPRNTCYDGYDSVKLMTNSGGIVSLPYDLRLPFARYVAWNGIKSIRRYSIAKVYREKKAFGHIPKEMYECAFDIVTSDERNPKSHWFKTLNASVKMIQFLHDLSVTLPGLYHKEVFIRLNHMCLLYAILYHCGIKDRHSEYLRFISDSRKNKVTPRNYRNTSDFNMTKITKVEQFFNKEIPFEQLRKVLSNIIKHKNTEAAKLARFALHELQSIIDKFKIQKTKILIYLGLIYSTPQYSGMICQLVYSTTRKNKPIKEVIAVGGRYDALIKSFNDTIGVPYNGQSAVGISIYLEKLIMIYTQYLQDFQQSNRSQIVSVQQSSGPRLFAPSFILCSRQSGVKGVNLEDSDDSDDANEIVPSWLTSYF